MCLLEPNDYYPYSMPMKPTIKTNLKIMNHVLTCDCFLFISLAGMKYVATNSLRGCVENCGKVPIVAFNKTHPTTYV